jgi:hypothetical protein
MLVYASDFSDEPSEANGGTNWSTQDGEECGRHDPIEFVTPTTVALLR